MKFGIFYELQLPKPWAPDDEYRLIQNALTQVELAELAGCSTRFVHTVEAGKPTLRLDAVLRLLATLGLRLELTGPGSTGPADLGERGR